MRASRPALVLCSILIIFGVNLAGTDELPARIAVADTPTHAELVTPWDPASPQKLVRLEGVLFQEDAGFYYRVVEDRVSIRLAPGVESWDDLLEKAGRAAPRSFAALHALEPVRQNRLGIIDLSIPDGSPADWAPLLFETGLVRYAEVATYGVYLATQDDPLYPQQWALNNTGQTGGTPGADVDAERAWDITAGDPATVVAVLDSGTFVTHVDLALNVWHNEGEIPDNGVDDDGNGFIDDVDGWDFGNNNNNVASNNYHGTHVTGIITAAGSNGTGISGLAGGLGGPGARSMALAVGESGPNAGILDDALIYATDNGAQVITMSLSVGATSAINDALGYAYNENDVFIDCAAGNSGFSVSYPAVRPEVVAVASTTDDDTRSSFSNPGPEVELAAPGSSILSTQLNHNYGTSSGTSFAAPYVAALAALVRSVNPGLPAPEVRQLMIDTAEDIESPGFDNLTGWGRINAFEAVSQAGFSDGTIELDAAIYGCAGTLSVTVTDFDLAGGGPLVITVKSLAEPGGEQMVLTEGEFSVFGGTLDLDGGAAVPDGLLQVIHADTITAEYLDEDDGQGGTDVLKTATGTTDCAGPQISGAGAYNIDDSSASVGWATDEPATSLVRYGSTIPPDQESSSGGLATIHLVSLSNLEQCTIYKFELQSDDVFGNSGVDDNSGLYYSFRTQGFEPGEGVVSCRLGRAQLDRQDYGCDASVTASVTDIDLDLDPASLDVVQVLMTSTTEPAGEWITLTETAVDSGDFEGPITLDAASQAGDGTLGAADGDLISVTYHDANDGQGNTRVSTFTSTAECAAPAIGNVTVTAISSTRAEVTWTTDEPATSRLDFGADASLGSTVEDLALKTSHRLALSAFEACDRVHFRVASADQWGDVRIGDAAGVPFELNLNQIGGLVFHDNFETDDGWNMSGEWERGSPQGQGSSSGDPSAAYSGAGVLGCDLSGTGGFPGDYEPGSTDWATTPSISTLGIPNVELIVKRKLGVSAGDEASIGMFAGFSLHAVWDSDSGVDDGEWVELRYPLPAGGDRASISVGFGINSASTSHSYGWNLDEVIVKDSTQPDYLTCGDCSGAPSFGGITAAYDAEPCAASGLTLEWTAAPAWGTGGGGTYDVHRGTTPSFTPDSGNLVAGGLTGTSWTDDGAPLDTEVWYVVRARNDESCAGGAGLADGNLVRLSATETLTQAAAPAVGPTLQARAVGAAHVRLEWDAVAGADRYIVRRSRFSDFGSPEVRGETEQTLFEDVDAANDENLYFYRIFSLNACGDESP
jgi:subtilisin family serine protease